MSFDRNLLPEPIEYYEIQGLILTGRGKWRTTECMFHGGSDSMRINVANGAWRCMSCGVHGGDVLSYQMQFHRTEFIESVQDIGAWVEDGKPMANRKPTSMSARDSIQVLATESNLIAIAGHNVANRVALSEEDLHRVLVAARRISHVQKDFS
jgi:hypothetical protein